MKITHFKPWMPRVPHAVLTGSLLLLLAACATDAVEDPDAAKSRLALTELQTNPNLASRAPIAIHNAELAVAEAEQPQSDPAVSAHLVYLADRRIGIARANAQTKYDEDQRQSLVDENSRIQLDARTREADAAKRQNGELQIQSAAAIQANADLQAQLAALQARKTDRGMVLTLPDTLFSTGRSDLKAGSVENLDRLVTFLGQEQDRNVRIEGHTDNRGGRALNQALSLARADSVASYLTERGISSSRVTSIGEGFDTPVADNGTEAGRQANRRVEVIIQDAAP